MDHIYFDLDTILDTRFAVLSKHNPRLAAQVLENGYRDRTMDEFPGLSRDEFMKLYDQRDVSTLQAAFRTNIFALMHGIAKGQLSANAMGNSFDEITYVVNVYPYELTDEEIEALRDVIELCALDTYPVKMVSISDQELTPKYCKQYYAMMVRYHFAKWVDLHAKEFQENPMPAVTVVAPAIFEKQVDLDKLRRQGLPHPFQALETALAPVFALRLMEVSLFSLDDGIRVRETPDPVVQTDG